MEERAKTQAYSTQFYASNGISRISHLLIASVALMLIVGCTWLAALRADRILRVDLLKQANMIAYALNPKLVASLRGNAADLTSPDYKWIKEQLTRIRLSNPDCRFLYLMNRGSDGTITILVDSEPADSKDYSPPGQTYNEAPGELHKAFSTGRAVVKGPYDDRWGKWVSAFVPIKSPVLSGTQTVFGMDIAAADWTWTIASHAALSAALVCIIVMLSLIVILLHRSRQNICRHQEALRESEFRSRGIIQAIPDLMFCMNREGVFLDYKADIKDLHDQSDSTIIGKRNRDITPPEFADLIEKQIQTTLETGSLQAFEYQLTIPGRGLRDYEARMVATGKDEVMAIVRDITERKLAEEELKESEYKFKVLTEKAVVGVYLVQDGKFKYVNPKLMDLLGYEEDEIAMKPIEGFVYSEDWPMVRENYRKRLSGELDNIRYQFRMIKKNGDVIFVEAHGSRIQYKGQPTIIGTMIDISDRKHAEEELRHRMKLQGILEMSGTICHEFNQPMQAVSCCTELLMSCPSADVNCHRKLQMIKEQTERMGKITMKLMTLNNYSVRDYIGIGNIVNIHEN